MKIRYFLRKSKENFIYINCQLNIGSNRIFIYLDKIEFKKSYKVSKSRKVILFNDLLGIKVALIKHIELDFLNKISCIIFEIPNFRTKFLLPIKYKNIEKNILLIKLREFLKVDYYSGISSYFIIDVNYFYKNNFKSVFLSDLSLKTLNIDKKLFYMDPLIFVIKRI